MDMRCQNNAKLSWNQMELTVYLLFALHAGTYTPKIKFGEIK